ncbi:Cortactin-binding protein 2, partial [Clarias magur]
MRGVPVPSGGWKHCKAITMAAVAALPGICPTSQSQAPPVNPLTCPSFSLSLSPWLGFLLLPSRADVHSRAPWPCMSDPLGLEEEGVAECEC